MNRYTTGFLWLLILTGFYLVSTFNYIIFHTLSELLSIVVAFGIFIITWNARKFLIGNFLLFIGIAYFFVGIFDIFHTLAYKGMAIFKISGSDLASQLWIASRYIESISLLLVPFFIHRKLNVHYIFASYLLISATVLVSIFQWSVFPDCFIEVKGLTPFKIISEYIICLILAASIILLYGKKTFFDGDVFKLIIWSIIIKIFSELAFTLYVDLYGMANLIGHYLKIVSFYFLYRAVIVTGLEKPFALLLRELKLSEESLRKHKTDLEELVDKRTEELVDLSKRLVEAENRERQRIARELHDIVGQNLTALGINLNIIRTKLQGDAVDIVHGRIEDSLSLVHETTEEIRDLMVDLHPPVLDDYGLATALKWYGDQFSLRMNIPVTVIEKEALPRLPIHFETALFRIAQESLNNVAKHAMATSVEITLAKNTTHVVLTIYDNGTGFDMTRKKGQEPSSSRGLMNMHERARSIGGVLTMESQPGYGTTVHVEVPL